MKNLYINGKLLGPVVSVDEHPAMGIKPARTVVYFRDSSGHVNVQVMNSAYEIK